MSAHSGGVMDWNSIIKPLLNNRNEVLKLNEIANYVKVIIRMENDLFDDDNNFLQFYTAFAALAADKLSQCIYVSPTQVPQIHEACAILIRFILHRLDKVSVYEIKWLLPALKGLCETTINKTTTPSSGGSISATGATLTGGSAATLQFDHNVVALVLKNSKYPENTKGIVSSSSSSSSGTGSSASEKDSPKAEIKRSRSDLSSIIIQQLTAPLEAGKITWAPLTEELTDCSEIFYSSNISYLQSLNGADVILDVCSLPILTRYRLKYQETIANLSHKPLYLPLTQVEATQIKNTLTHMVQDILILDQALTLPIFKPLTPSRITKLSKCAISALYCAVLTSIASSILSMANSATNQKGQTSTGGGGGGGSGGGGSGGTTTASGFNANQSNVKDMDDNEENARFVVDKSLEIYTTIGNMFKNDARCHIYQNHLCFGAWLLVSGIQGALGATGSSSTSSVASSSGGAKEETVVKGKSKTQLDTAAATQQSTSAAAPTARVNLFKVQQGFGVLNAAIANHCIKLLAELIEDLKVETTSSDIGNQCDSGTNTSMPEPANFDILQNYTTLQRVMRILNTATLHQLFTFLATVTYRKACNLKRANAKDRTECEPISYSDSTTYFNDTLSSSDNSEEDDSESYLGHWFKETLLPETHEENTTNESQERSTEAAQKSNLVPALDEPHEYLDLAAQIFSFLDQFFAQKHNYLQRYVKAGLSDQQMLLLANILKDLDRDAARGESESVICSKWQAAMIRFSGSVGRYLHNLISGSLVNETLQSNLLQHLGVSPWSTETNTWPLLIYPSTLSVLVQVILLKPTQEKEAACLSVWHRLINTLVEGVCGNSLTNLPSDVDYEDLNMEHAQLLLFLFHSLNLMQKKSILLLTAGGVIRCAEVCREISMGKPIRNSQIMLLSRLLLFLEYLMKHLYNAPPELLDQVRWNLFSISTLHEDQKISDLLNNKAKLLSFCRKDIEEKFRKSGVDCVSNMRPTFYSLTVVNDLHDFKLDGLAWNFILCTPDKLKYPLLVNALIDILTITDMTLSWQSKSNIHTLCAVSYCFGICWKLLLGLPPSTTHVEQLLLDKSPNLHSLMWSIRCPMSHHLIITSLIKQGMYTHFAESLWNNVTTRVRDIKFSLIQTLMGVKAFNEIEDKANLRLSSIMLLDALLAHMHATAWAEKEGIKPERVYEFSSGANNTDISNVVAAPIVTTASEDIYTSTLSDSETTDDERNFLIASNEQAQCSQNLLIATIETLKILVQTLRDKMMQQITDLTPHHLLNHIIPIVNSNNTYSSDLYNAYLKLLPNEDKEMITTEWRKCLPVTETIFQSSAATLHYPVEEYTSAVIEAHISELTHYSYYTTLNSLKHCLKSILCLMNLLIGMQQQPQQQPQPQLQLQYGLVGEAKLYIASELRPILIEIMLDARMEYVYYMAEKCLQTLIGDVEHASMTRQLMTYKYMLKNYYQLILKFSEELRTINKDNASAHHQPLILNESVLMVVLKSMTQMLDKPIGVKAMFMFFVNKRTDVGEIEEKGSLTELLLSFNGTTLSMSYARRMLQFIEKLFQLSTQPNAHFPHDQLVDCFADFPNVEADRIKSWLSHIIYGPQGFHTITETMDKVYTGIQPSSTPSSNAQTPTNMATVSAMPSITDQLAQSSVMDAPEDMDIDDDVGGNNINIAAAAATVAVAAGGGGGSGSGSGVIAAITTTATTTTTTTTTTMSGLQVAQSLGLWRQKQQQTGSSLMATNQSELSTQDDQSATQTERNGALLLSVVKYIVCNGKGGPPGVALLLFQSLLQLGQSLIAPPQEAADFADILQIMITLADTSTVRGHATLFNVTIIWLEMTKFQVLEKAHNLASLIMPSTTLDNINALLRYLGELLQSLGYRGSKYLQPPWDDDIQTDLEELMDELGVEGDEDSLVDDSDEDSLNNKLCTFSQTQKEFMNQHWYHCHTCNMVNTVGVCSICARVCHKGHDVSYAKYGNFFCDCGAKEDGSCQALSRRISTAATHNTTSTTAAAATVENRSSQQQLPQTGEYYQTTSYAANINSGPVALTKRTQTPPYQVTSLMNLDGSGSGGGGGGGTSSSSSGSSSNVTTVAITAANNFGLNASQTNDRISLLSKLLESSRELLKNPEQWNIILRCILDFFDVLIPAIRENCEMFSIVGCHKRAKVAMSRLHMGDQSFQITDQLMVATLGSQEGAFENVRMSYSGDQGQTIKQLLSSGLVRRVALCCLSSPHGKRQHLAVSHEKGKVTILQLSALLKQADAAKRKLTLTQLSSAPIPCTVLSLTANPTNEDCLAVCGLKECHILTFTNTGSTNDHIVLTPQLENGNFIKKALWLPGSQTMLALVTADYVKIYELAEDAYSPEYYFLVAVGKIRDCTFVYQDGSYNMLIIASTGYIYYQKLDDQSKAKHGDFYVTNTLELNHTQIKDINGQVAGGGVSIYYSHTLQLLFFSYSVGRSFVAPLIDVNKGVKCITHLQMGQALKNSSKGPPQPLCQWTEIPGHPGLICAMMHTSNNPVIFMFTPDRIIMQEIKAQSSKSRIMDMVAIRHSVAGVEKTTLILLCEDGSLRIFTAQPETTSFWLSPQVQPLGNQLYTSSLYTKNQASALSATASNAPAKKAKRKSSHQQKTTAPNGDPIFPIDFFEHCTMLTDVEFGGNDLLQIYNKQKLKSRLFSTGMYVASTKPNGFTLEIYNNDPNMVIVGIRVLLGTQDPMRSPLSVTIWGRTVPTLERRARWFDIPFTREEILQSDKCVKVYFLKSIDPENVTMLDSIEVYGKSKDGVGWPEETDEVAGAAAPASGTNVGNAAAAAAGGVGSGVGGGGTGVGGGSAAIAGAGNYDGYHSITNLDKMVTNLLDVVDCALNLLGGSSALPTAIKQKATKTATSLLLMPTPNQVQVQSRYVLATLFGNRAAYHAYKDYEILLYVCNELQQMKPKLSSRETLKDIDPEAFYRLVLMVRGIATARPQSLARICIENKYEILADLMECVEQLHQITPQLDEPTSIVRQGLCHTETIVHCLVEIMHAFALADITQVERMIKYFIALLKSESSVISHSAKEAIILLLNPRLKRRKVAIITPPVCSTPTPPVAVNTNAGAIASGSGTGGNVTGQIQSEGGVGGDALDEAGAVTAGGGNRPGGSNHPSSSNVARRGSSEYLRTSVAPTGDPIVMVDPLEAFIGGGFPQLLGLQQDADDEAIMDFAIALSLQQHEAGESGLQQLQQDLSNLQGIRNVTGSQMAQNAQQQFPNAAGTSASAAGSDDEGSNIATDGSTLRTSPAEPAGSGGSESGGSGVESIGGTSGRSSTYGEAAGASGSLASVSSSTKCLAGAATSDVQVPSTSRRMQAEVTQTNETGENETNEDEKVAKLHDLRIAVLESFIANINTLDDCNGLRAVPLIQVILMLTTDLNGNNERDQKILNDLLIALVKYVGIETNANAAQMKEKCAKNEVRLAVLSVFGVLMGKTKSKQAGTTSPPHQFKDNASFVATTTATVLSNHSAFPFCLVIMESLLQHWKRLSNEQNQAAATTSGTSGSGGAVSAIASSNNSATTPVVGGGGGGSAVTPTQNNLLKPVRHGPKPDISTLIPHNYLKSYPDIFESYDTLLTEVSVRLPYQILRLSATHPCSFDWYLKYCESMTYTLCEYMMLNLNALLRRQVRKLLMYICGNKEKFRMFRDGHSLDVHFNCAKALCNLYDTKNLILSNQCIPILSYDSLVELTEHLRTCQEISQIRTGNWQKFCLIHEDVIPVLIEIACYQLDDGVSPIILQLLQAAMCNNVQAIKQQQQQQQPQQQQPQQQTEQQSTSTGTKPRSERDKSEETEMSFDSKFDAAHCSTFVHQIYRYVSDILLNKFVRIYLLETNITSIRWQAHSLIFAIYEHSNDRQKEKLINILWNMWPLVPAFGRRTAQFVDILGYLTLSTKTIAERLPEYTEKAVEVLRQQNDLLSKHSNGTIYTALEQILQMNGYYLESEPCLVCNNPEVPMNNIKLPSIKSDTKFTTTTMIVKLVQCHTISKLVVRIADLKRTKMVRTINIYYNNRTVQAVVELKNRQAMWHKARTAVLQSGQTEVKIDFPLPITACNLMIEYADFYETVTGSSENLQCPRCSAAVPSYPGVCGNCGENVFQCHKCRAINYDEKDPFLCHSCGFCKYAKFDFSIYGRVCCAVDPIESAEDRAKTVQIIHSSLERADRIYRQLLANKQMLELLLQKFAEHGSSDRLMDENLGTIHSTSQVNKIIQLLALKYCVESRASFEELSKIVQKVKACRSELVAYDRIQMDQQGNQHTVDIREHCAINKCYGCALASTEQCLTLLRAMASNYDCRLVLYSQGLVDELAHHNLRRGTPQIQDEVRNLLVLLTKNNRDACMGLLDLITDRVKAALLGTIPLTNLDSVIHHEMELLRALISQDDFCWEQKLKVVFELFLLTCRTPRGPVYSVIQPCLHIMFKLISPDMAKSVESTSPLISIPCLDGISVDFQKWLQDDEQHTYEAWRARMPTTVRNQIFKVFMLNDNNASDGGGGGSASASASGSSGGSGGGGGGSNVAAETGVFADILQAMVNDHEGVAKANTNTTTITNTTPTTTTSTNDKETNQQTATASADVSGSDGTEENTVKRRQLIRKAYLMEKYGLRWRTRNLSRGLPYQPLLLTANWLQPILFHTNSRFRRPVICSLVFELSRTHERKREILNLLTSFLKHVGEAGEASSDFLSLYRLLIDMEPPWREYLALRGVLTEISQLLTDEIVKIHRLEETTLSSDLSQGYALQQFVELLAFFFENPQIRKVYKTRLLGPVLEGYLSLRKLVVQRTRLIDDAQEKLLEMLEEMTSGTEEETRAFMEILIDTVEKTPVKDIKTPVFIFERLFSIIHPEENDESEFLMTLEKDPQQEDFLQGRMLGNPYPSTEVGLGPLMRDIKNKICTDCELIALLEDDNGMELLVNNKIISLDLPVKDVYRKVWLAEGGERDAMRIVYRMRGLLGDATEEFVETLNNKSQEEVDTEQLYRMANVLADCNGLKVMLNRIGSLQSIARTRELIQVLLKLFLICVKVRRCREVLCQPELGAVNTLLKVLQMCLQSEPPDSIQSSVTEQLLEIMETVLSKAASDTLDSFLQFSLTFGGPEYVTALISCTDCSNVRNNPSVLRHLIRVLAALVYGNEVKMGLLCEHFKDILDFERLDAERNAEEEFKLELFCVLTNQIEHNCIGGTLKDYIMGLGIVEQAINYITRYAPCVKPTLLRTDSDELKEFISRPSLKYILRFLTGLANKHEATQLAISKDIIPIIHRLEQVSSDEHVGSLAENLLEALCTDAATAARVQEVRDFTRTEKKRLAMATREKQLDALGMRTNEKGQVTAKGSILQKIEKLRDETGLTCFICREGYACQPAKVLGIYTFTKRCNVEEFELKTRKTIGYTTVTHFNVVHVDCHTSAIRLARGRDEWERASLQNANTRCNGLLPLWGPDVSEAAFSACMTRHTSYMQESTQRCDISYTNSIHDLKLLLMRFAWERSFHDDAGGGGPQSNMHFVPYSLFYAVYLLLSSRSAAARDNKTLLTYLTAPPTDKWLECAYDIDGPLYMLTMSLSLHSPELWYKHKVAHLKRLIVVAQARNISPTVICKALLTPADRQEKDYVYIYRPYCMMWALVDLFYNKLFKSVAIPKEEDWTISLFNYIRKNDEVLLKQTDDILETFTEDFLPCTSFEEFCDVAGLFAVIENPLSFITEILSTLPTTVQQAAAPASSSSSSAGTTQ